MKGIIKKERERRLDAIGFCWEPKKLNRIHDGIWYKQFAALKAFKAEHGHMRVPADKDPKYKSLCYWIWDQRKYQKKGKLPAEKEEQLREVGFTFGAPPTTNTTPRPPTDQQAESTARVDWNFIMNN